MITILIIYTCFEANCATAQLVLIIQILAEYLLSAAPILLLTDDREGKQMSNYHKIQYN